MAGLASVVAVIMGVVTGPIGSKESPSLIPEPGPGDYPASEPAVR
jgi:hypothetical protein